MKTKLHIYHSAGTELARSVRVGIDNLEAGATSFTAAGLLIHVGLDGAYVETDEYLHEYPAWVTEASVWQVAMTCTYGSSPIAPGIFVKGDTKACLYVEYAPSGERYYRLDVQGKHLDGVQKLLRTVQTGEAEKHRTETWNH